MTTRTGLSSWRFGTDWTREWLPKRLKNPKALKALQAFLGGSARRGESFVEDIWAATHGLHAEMIPMIGDITKEDELVIRREVDEIERTEPDACKVRQADTLFLERRFANANKRQFLALVRNLVQYLKEHSSREDRNGASCDFEAFFKPALVKDGYWDFMGPLFDAELGCPPVCYESFENMDDMSIFAEFPHDPENLPKSTADNTTKPCRECRGKGTTRRCLSCSGRGERETYDDVFEKCDTCKGSGFTDARDCIFCDGRGILRRYPVQIPCTSLLHNEKGCLDCNGTGHVWTLGLS